MAHFNYDCTPDSDGNLLRLLISFVLLTFARFTEFIKDTEIIADFVLKIFQMGAYGATIGMFIFTLYKFINDKK